MQAREQEEEKRKQEQERKDREELEKFEKWQQGKKKQRERKRRVSDTQEESVWQKYGKMMISVCAVAVIVTFAFKLLTQEWLRQLTHEYYFLYFIVKIIAMYRKLVNIFIFL